LVIVLAAAALPAAAQEPKGRQYYSRFWQRQGGYYYRTYYYRPTPNADYRAHQVIYYPSRPRYYYYYNPYTNKYWGRCDRATLAYSKLAPEDQRQRLADIPEEAFPKAGPMPAIPESEDGTRMQPPPGNLPPDESETLSKDRMKEKLPQMGDREPPRQVYGDWCQQGGYYFCCYYCQPRAGGDYVVHRCIFYPQRPRYIYYYNPVNQKYWGRFDLEEKGYSLLVDADRAGRLADIRPEAFPKPGEMPPIPGSNDGTRMEMPPRELPE
jgi:hypothetical protein